jgi:hypothetical protein
MRANYLYAAVMATMLAGWFAKNPPVPPAPPAPAPSSLNSNAAALGLDLAEAKQEGQCNLEFINQTLLDAKPFTVSRNAPLNLTGWAMDDKKTRLPTEVIVRFTGAENADFFAMAQAGLPRADVKEHFKVSDALLMSGFQLLITSLDLPAGEYRLTLLMRFDDAIYSCDNGRRLLIH